MTARPFRRALSLTNLVAYYRDISGIVHLDRERNDPIGEKETKSISIMSLRFGIVSWNAFVK